MLDVARWVRDELDALKAPGFPKTSGAGGLHIYVPMPPGTPYEAGLLFAQIVATMVAQQASEGRDGRALDRGARPARSTSTTCRTSRGKTLASAYSARANEFAGVSTPLTWDEVEAGVSPQDFTIAQLRRRGSTQSGDLWAALRKAKGAEPARAGREELVGRLA